MSALVECIPNFSEGRRPEVINAILDAIRTAAPVRLLDTSSDADHNRTVVTFAGTPADVEKAAFAAIATAARLIDLDVHRGAHPRMGATDVVPFVPIRDVTMDECVAIAKRLGARVGSELNIPVYLYEAAATRPDREDLANVRRGEYEGIKSAILTDPARQPDFGPAQLGTAGATVIGARPALIAFNVYLTTDNIEIAKKIAKAIRHSSGGLRYVKALGLLVDGRAQVSMNLTNFDKTPIYRAVEMIRREATRYGVAIAFSELVGLTPEEALIDTARWYLQLDMFQPDQLLERRLQNVDTPPADTATVSVPVTAAVDHELSNSVISFVDKVAAGTPAPGGGSVAALAAALASALSEMVGHLTEGRKKYADAESEIQSALLISQESTLPLLHAIDDDSAAYRRVMTAYKIPKDDPTHDVQVQTALYHAALTPFAVMEVSVEIMRDSLLRVAKVGNVNAVTDAGVGAHMALAAVESAALNVRINLKELPDRPEVKRLRALTNGVLAEARALHTEIITIVEQRAGLS